MHQTDQLPPIRSRSDLMSLLTLACELEHGLACSYLYSAFTLKQSVYENDLTAEQFRYVRKWAGQLYFIAAQEMMHLSQAWNLLTAIGGTPYYMRPDFPQAHKYYPTDLPLRLEPFGRKALKRFILYELPSTVSDTDFLEREFHIPKSRINTAFTVGKLYAQIEGAFTGMPESMLFIGNPEQQVGADLAQFNELVKVADRASAIEGIQNIIEQGEGNPRDEVDCHYGLFINMEQELTALSRTAEEAGASFYPARNVIQNPVTVSRARAAPAAANMITAPYTNQVAELFDDLYGLMLRILQFTFQSGPLPDNMQAILCDAAIQIMTRVIKPLGEALTLLPAGQDEKYTGMSAGPSFGLHRHVSLPTDSKASRTIINERLAELVETAQKLAADYRAPAVLRSGIEQLAAISRKLAPQ